MNLACEHLVVMSILQKKRWATTVNSNLVLKKKLPDDILTQGGSDRKEKKRAAQAHTKKTKARRFCQLCSLLVLFFRENFNFLTPGKRHFTFRTGIFGLGKPSPSGWKPSLPPLYYGDQRASGRRPSEASDGRSSKTLFFSPPCVYTEGEMVTKHTSDTK